MILQQCLYRNLNSIHLQEKRKDPVVHVKKHCALKCTVNALLITEVVTKIVCAAIVKILKEINNLLKKQKVMSSKKGFIIVALHKKDVIAKNLHAKKNIVNATMREQPVHQLVDVKTVVIQKIQMLKNCKVSSQLLRIVFLKFSRVVFYKRVSKISKIYEITSLMMFFLFQLLNLYDIQNSNYQFNIGNTLQLELNL